MKLKEKLNVFGIVVLLGIALTNVPFLIMPQSQSADGLTDQNQMSDLVIETSKFPSSIDNQNLSNSEDKESSYVGGQMVQSYHETNHSKLKMVVWGTDLRKDFVLRSSSQYEIIIVSTYVDYKKELMGSFASCIIGSISNELSVEERAELSQESISWAAKGNLLIVGDVGLIMSGLHNEIGVVDLFTLPTKERVVQLLPTTALVHNLPLSQLLIASESHGFVLSEDADTEIAAICYDNATNQTVPIALLSKLGNGYCISLGFDLAAIETQSSVILARNLVFNALRIYASVNLAIYTDSFEIERPISPNVHPLSSNHTIIQALHLASGELRELGFNVFHNNLLYSDDEGGYFASLSVHGSLASFVGVFESHLDITFRNYTSIEFATPYSIPNLGVQCLDRIAIVLRPNLYWPTGWDPPKPSYYHLAPNVEAVMDMGANEWVPHSVEEITNAALAQSRWGYDGSGVHVAVIDTGFSQNVYPDNVHYPAPMEFHPYYEEYYPQLLEDRYTAYPTDSHLPADDYDGHGTGITSNLLAIAPGIELDFISYEDVIEAFTIVLSIEPDVVSCSWGWPYGQPSQHPEVQNLIQQATENGIIVVFAVGNGDVPNWPGSEPCVVSVGGVYVNEYGALEASNYTYSGIESYFEGRVVPDVCGVVGQQPYGMLIEMPTQPESWRDYNKSIQGDETDTDDGWWVASGSSSAAPAVAGLAAIMKEIDPDINVGRFKHVAMSTCTDITTGESATGDTTSKGFDAATGAGLIDVYRALETVLEYSASNVYVEMTVPGGRYNNFYSFTGPYGPSYHTDTSGSSERSYTFFGYLASCDGAIMTQQGELRISGWFRQYDTFPPYLQEGRRYLKAYILSVDGRQILTAVKILDHNDGTGWKFITKTITGLPERGLVRVAFGRTDHWSTDWQLTAEWSANVMIYSPHYWFVNTWPSGKPYNWGESLAPDAHMGETWRIDTIGYSDRNYYFYHYSDVMLNLYTGREIRVSGWFRQDDTFDTYGYEEGRRYLKAYIIDPIYGVTSSFQVLDHYDGTDWLYRHYIFTCPQIDSGSYYIAFGRYDHWTTDWELVAEICNVRIAYV